MSDLSLQLQQASSQLPVSSYFDEALYQREIEVLFKQGPRYVGHSLAVSELGDYHALPQEREGRALVHTAQGVELVSDVCRHRQAVMLKGRGNLNTPGTGTGGNIVCPLHRWTYAPSGQLLGAPHFQHDPCLDLNNYKLQNWNGLLFEDNGRDIAADLADMGPRHNLNFEGYALDRVELHECNYNWKTFIEVYLEDYHVGPFHPGLGHFVTCDDLQWEFKKRIFRTNRGGGRPIWQSRQPGLRALEKKRCWPTAMAACPNKGRSGSPTIPTSWWSGIPMC